MKKKEQKKEQRYLVILDYGKSVVRIEKVSRSWNSEDVEEYLFGNGKGQLDFRQSEIDWMLSDTLDIQMRWTGEDLVKFKAELKRLLHQLDDKR